VQTISVLLALAEDPGQWRHGYDLCQETGLKAGSMYPILIRLADRGWLETSWEVTTSPGRPPRHLYRLTRSGLDVIRELGASRATRGRARRARLNVRLQEMS
jgi:DNA-binding PadR family transcriptional regulator